MAATMTVTWVGKDLMKQRLNALDRNTSLQVLQPIVESRTQHVFEMIKSGAPVRKDHGTSGHAPGMLRSGIVMEYVKGGIGYCYFQVKLTDKVWWGVFQEFGLGDKSQRGPSSAKVVRRQERYIGRREAAKQSGKKMRNRYGQRHNMAAQPFMRPAVRFAREWFLNGVYQDVWNRVVGAWNTAT